MSCRAKVTEESEHWQQGQGLAGVTLEVRGAHVVVLCLGEGCLGCLYAAELSEKLVPPYLASPALATPSDIVRIGVDKKPLQLGQMCEEVGRLLVLS
ncbi:hypothetical protein BAUCODRAFT_477419 [Baudoinia panamericana UAMH 10762]|uniref:Uncharacterized protein n=1 Tax=Baudoinia panamericana (strain UAMH 10762) TaxID=717646 RepID=M2NCA1_BAUPA|nr:uncharacterized protein BAUCODRAFT_477419 [Baudoinia panamericana UAMH 10762]EMC96495.1 hypothetical protein BAUCODRAFT_477419 [Baudoinia panamericana UAMH 10762]